MRANATTVALSAITIPCLLLVMLLLPSTSAQAEENVSSGELLNPAAYGESYVESMEAALERARTTPPPTNDKTHQGQQGAWVIPSRGAISNPCSGTYHAVNKWGDTCMGIGFPDLVNVHGAFFAAHGDQGVRTTGVRVLGYRAGRLVQQTDWLDQLETDPVWFTLDLRAVDRMEIISVPVHGGGGWYALDDLTYSFVTSDGATMGEKLVVDFEDLDYRTVLTDSGYAGLSWEHGTGAFSAETVVHSPQTPPGPGLGESQGMGEGAVGARGSGTEPFLLDTFQGVLRGDAGSMSGPPDTDGAVGPNHYVETVNRNFAVYDKETGAELVNILLGAFLPGSNGDPRVLFDHHSGRWIVLVTDFSATATIFLAVSLTDDPTGDWFKTSFFTAEGSDSGTWPDYPTLGVDVSGIYTAAYMIGGGGMTIFAIDKAPLIAPAPSLGVVTAFRGLSWEGALQPAHTYGTPAGEYVVSLYDGNELRVRRVNMQTMTPTLTELGTVTVDYYSEPPNAPALGSSVPLNTVGSRLMMSVYRDGSLWTSHTIASSGRAACRWYEIDVASMTLVQSGTVADSSLYYFFPSIMVNQHGDAVMAFTGSRSSQYAGCYYTGRAADDPLGEMALPVLYKAGTGPQNLVDGYGRNRWGDYSYTTLDPSDDTTFWTIQEYGHATDIWGTYIGVLRADPEDCNDNSLFDGCDLDCGTPGGSCDVSGCGEAFDCNLNGVPDECDLAGGTSYDCNLNNVPDECETLSGPDADDDGDVDLDDYKMLADFCAAGPDEYVLGAPECAGLCLAAFDSDADNDIDLADFAAWVNAFTGSN